ncbi:MAG: hypothetical protein LBJ12_08275 [Oscillospiraceae bacterium]|jgi:beta-galactosidase|nr:hypothetical protein [Oscillospiraceae bacterium]
MRSVAQLNERWFYLPGDTVDRRPPRFRDKHWQEVKLPHTPDDGFPARYWYCKTLRAERMPGERLYLRIDSPAANCRVFANGVELEKLRSGTVHTVELTRHHRPGKPLRLAFRFRGGSAQRTREDSDLPEDVALDDNMAQKFPKEGTLYGGFPHGLTLISVPVSHFSFDAKGGCGVNIQTEMRENGAAKIKVNATVLLPTEGQKITFAIGGPRIAVPVSVPAAEFAIPRPRLWSPVDPFLYSLRAILTHQDGTHLDTVDVPFGVRDLRLTPEGVKWNGYPVPTRGLTRKTPVPGIALPPEKEFAILRELCVDTLILTGTPEQDAFFALCDSAALRVFQAVPPLKDYKNRKDGLDAAKKLLFRLMNHPCVIGWAISAEGESESSIRAMCELLRHADPSRPILLTDCEMAFVRDMSNFPADAASVTLQSKDDLKTLDRLRAEKPKLPLGISINTLGTDIGFAQAVRDIPQTRPWLSVFSAGPIYKEGEACALLTQKHIPEDRYFLLKTIWAPSSLPPQPEEKSSEKGGAEGKAPATQTPVIPPFVHIRELEKDHRKRVVVYSNFPSVTLSVNGEKFRTLEAQGIFVFDGLELKEGANQILATAGDAANARTLSI